MTTTATAKKAKKKSGKPLRIRPELLPGTATYGTFSGKEYLMIPVEEFGDWYEDITLGAIAQDRLDNAEEPPLPFSELRKAMRK